MDDYVRDRDVGDFVLNATFLDEYRLLDVWKFLLNAGYLLYLDLFCVVNCHVLGRNNLPVRYENNNICFKGALLFIAFV